MTPFVIDNQKTRRYITVFILLLIVSFALGYASGFYMSKLDKADAPVVSDIPSEPLDSSSQDEQTPDVKEEGDAAPQPEIKSEVSPPAKTEKNVATAAPPKVTKSAPVPVSQAKETKTTPEKTITEKKPEPVKPVAQQPEPARSVVAITKTPEPLAEVQNDQAKPEEENSDNTQEANMTNDGNVFQSSQRMFSVQVGVFANRENALNLVEELKNGGFDAYLDDFVASGGEVKYNVRFGRESDRGLIQQQLSKYKQQFSTSAYIIISK